MNAETVYLTNEYWRSLKIIRDQAKLIIIAWEKGNGQMTPVLADRLVTLRHVLKQEVQG
jgi:hypothetical protein